VHLIRRDRDLEATGDTPVGASARVGNDRDGGLEADEVRGRGRDVAVLDVRKEDLFEPRDAQAECPVVELQLHLVAVPWVDLAVWVDGDRGAVIGREARSAGAER
jgi:hypothetical protein